MLLKTDVLIIGSGAAGLTAALELADKFNVLIISKETLVDSSTWYAQGGIAAVLAKEDSTESHIKAFIWLSVESSFARTAAIPP